MIDTTTNDEVGNIQKIHWKETIEIRQCVLWPQKPPEHCYIPDDEKGEHFGYFIGLTLVSVASIYSDGKSVRLRKFATLKAHQGKGIGSRLLKHIISSIDSKDNLIFWCDARESAVAFYQRFGLSPEGNRFYKSDVPYFKMSRVL